MDVQHPPVPALHERGGEQAHEPAEADELDRVIIEYRLQCGLERRPVLAVGRVIEHRGCDAGLARGVEPGGIRPVRQHERDLGRIVLLRRRDQRRHVGAAPRDQDRDPLPHRARSSAP
jgi:hypothetical protein